MMNTIIIFTKKVSSDEKIIKNETIFFLEKITKQLKMHIVNF